MFYLLPGLSSTSGQQTTCATGTFCMHEDILCGYGGVKARHQPQPFKLFHETLGMPNLLCTKWAKAPIYRIWLTELVQPEKKSHKENLAFNRRTILPLRYYGFFSTYFLMQSQTHQINFSEKQMKNSNNISQGTCVEGLGASYTLSLKGSFSSGPTPMPPIQIHVKRRNAFLRLALGRF